MFFIYKFIFLDYIKLGKPILAYVFLALPPPPKSKHVPIPEAEKEIIDLKDIEGVEEINVTTGDYDLMLKVRFPDLDSLHDFLTNPKIHFSGAKSKTIIVIKSF